MKTAKRKTRAEADYALLNGFIAKLPKHIQAEVCDALESLVEAIAEKVVNQRGPKTLDDLRAWERDETLLDIGLDYLIQKYADDKHGYGKYGGLPCGQRPKDAWRPDYYSDVVLECGAINILHTENLHTAEDFIAWADETADWREKLKLARKAGGEAQ